MKYKPDLAVAYHTKGNALKNLGKLLEAIDNYDQAIRYSTNYAGSYNNKGSALCILEQYQEAINREF
ncbi:tetratricopeptide repeat protein [Orientia tsutsugamushi]|uniref:tetratricopeptide repeat protein n=1 Tax=Orientia tsutsugamushi TaxID=784 RepID=UPI0035285A38